LFFWRITASEANYYHSQETLRRRAQSLNNG